MRLFVSALLMLIALTAQAADGSALAGDFSTQVPVLKAPVKKSHVKPGHNWSGLYVGGHFGGLQSNNGWFFPSDSINSVAQNPTGVPFQGLFNNDPAGMAATIATGYQLPIVGPLNVSSGSNKASSWLVGAQLGYNFQFGNWVLGVEGEASWTSAKGSNVDPNYSITNHTDTDFIGVLAGRFGYAWDRVLLYGKAGGAWAHDNYSVYTNRSITVGNGSLPTTTVASGAMVDAASVNRFGFMLGGGVEYAISPQWSVKAEYQYLDFGTQRTTLTPKSAAVSPIDMDITQRIQIAKVGINYKLDQDPGAALASTDRFRDVRRIGPMHQISPTQRFYGGVEYLRWSVKGAPLSVPLVSTGPESTEEGIVTSTETTILYGSTLSPATGGNDTQNFKATFGVRLTFGYWFDDAQRLAVEVGGFKLQTAKADYNVSSDSTGSPGLSVPEYNSILYLPEGLCGPGDQGQFCGDGVGEDRSPAAIPDLLVGSVSVKNTLKFWGLHSNGVLNFIRTPMWDVSAIGGFRYLDLREDFNMVSTLIGIGPFSGQSGYTVDDFATRNQFYGALLGLRGRGKYGPFSVETTLSTALGFTHETISINGYYNAINFSSTSGPYGIFATPANQGTTSSNKFAVVPEAQVKFGYDITPNLKVTIGYDFIYWSNVVRPTDQINRNLVKGQFFQEDPYSTSSAYPQRLDKTTDFYAHGVSVGLTARF